MSTRYNPTHQSRSAAPSNYENLLADALERAYGQGLVELDALVAQLNQGGPSGPNGQAWTAENLQQELKRLGA